jgi:hypothetical protein
MLDFIYDRKRPFLSYLGWTTAAAWLSSGSLLWILSIFFARSFEGHASSTAIDMSGLITVIVVVPLLENLVMIGAIAALELEIENHGVIVLVVALSAGVIHGFAHQWMFISGAILFASMSKTFLDFESYSIWKRYLATLAQHMAFNAPAACYQYYFN